MMLSPLPMIIIMFLLSNHKTSALTLPNHLPTANDVLDPSDLLETLQIDNYTLTIYGYKTSPSRLAPVPNHPIHNPHCGYNTPSCDYSHHLAETALCIQLIQALKASPSYSPSNSPRDVCIGSSHKCCISWKKQVSGLRLGDLVSAAETVVRLCQNLNKGGVSGKTRDTLLAGSCTEQCLSDRKGGC